MKTLRTLLVPALLALALATPVAAVELTKEEAASAQIERIAVNLPKYISEVDRALSMAKEGGYGKLQRGSEARLAAARQILGDLLKDVTDPRTLPLDKQMQVYNAHAEIASILKHQDKGRVVCTRERKTGSRLSTTECLTVAEREERARVSAAMTTDTQRMTCSPGETSTCAR